MKSFHWILGLAVLVVVVFVITFFKMYLQEPRKQTPKTNTTNPEGLSSQLEFARTRYPSEKEANELPLQSEFGTPGWYDFWFHNPSQEKEVRLGLNGKNCVCSEVEIFLLQGQWHSKLAPLPLAPLVAGNPFNVLTSTVALVHREN